MSEWKQFRDALLESDPELKAEYDRLGPTYAAIADVIRLRLQLGLTQEQLAQKMGKQQPAIARLEAGRVKPSIAFLTELAEALDARLVLRIEGKDEPESRRAAS